MDELRPDLDIFHRKVKLKYFFGKAIDKSESWASQLGRVKRTTFIPEFHKLGNLVRRIWDLLKTSVATKILAESKIVVGYRRPSNLKDLLIKARVPQMAESNKQRPWCKFSNKCPNKKCKFCPLLDKGRIKSTVRGREFESKRNVTCRSSNTIYCITCQRFKKQYVGQTDNTLHEGFGAHSGALG